MRKGEVPVGYIIAIVLGVAVIGLIGYWLFTNYSKGSGTGGTAECLAYKAAACKGITLDEEKAKAACNEKTWPPWLDNDPQKMEEEKAKQCGLILPKQ